MSIRLGNFESTVQTFIELDLICEPIEPIKSGKEASVFRCRAHPNTGHAQVALKIYRPRAHRSFKNDSVYREGSLLERVGGGNTRAARALRSGTRFGRQVQEATWAGHEWEVLQRLHEAGLPVPAPIHLGDGAILMELFERSDGAVAPPLVAAELTPEVARALFAALCDDIEQMLWLDLLHGDLSPYNILWNGETYRVIDFPQAVDPRFNGNAPALLLRDIEHVAAFCARFAKVPEPAELFAAMWQRFLRGEPPT